jgi:prophage tail gpP-like protein
MASSADDIGNTSDQITLTLNGSQVLIAEAYEIRLSFFEQPSTFSITLGSGDQAKFFLQNFGPNIPFTLAVGNLPLFVGLTTAIEVNGDVNGTTTTIHGRDGMSALLETRLVADKCFSAATYTGLVQAVLDDLKLKQFVLITDTNGVSDNRKKCAGVPVQVLEVPPELADLLTTPLPQKPQVQGKAGEVAYHYLKRELERAAMFLRCGADGSYILSAPFPKQAPLYNLVRQRGASPNLVNVISHRFRFDTVGRSAHYVVLGRGGGAPTTASSPVLDGDLADLNLAVGARGPIKGSFDDPEMVELGYTNFWVKKDKHVTSSKQADFLAHRKAAQDQRHGFELTYKVSGHTVPAIAGGRAAWTVDTIVNVQDDELGLSGPFWIENVSMRRDMGGGTTTEIKLLKPDYLVFGGEDEGG